MNLSSLALHVFFGREEPTNLARWMREIMFGAHRTTQSDVHRVTLKCVLWRSCNAVLFFFRILCDHVSKWTVICRDVAFKCVWANAFWCHRMRDPLSTYWLSFCVKQIRIPDIFLALSMPCGGSCKKCRRNFERTPDPMVKNPKSGDLLTSSLVLCLSAFLVAVSAKATQSTKK